MEIAGIMVNPTAIGLCGLAAFALGYIWYGVLFTKQWVDAQRFTEMQKAELGKTAPIAMGVSFVGYLVTAVVMALIFGRMQVTDFNTALYYSVLMWFGFSAMMGLMHALYGGRSLVGLAIDLGYEFLYVSFMAYILVWWK